MKKNETGVIIVFLLALVFTLILIISSVNRQPTKPTPITEISESTPINNIEQKNIPEDKNQTEKILTQKLVEKPGEIIGTEINYQNVFNAVNQERYKANLKILKHNLILDKVAQDKLEDIVKYNYWAHTNPTTGATPWTWFEKERYKYVFAGENLATDYKTIQDTVSGWMNSETHKRNILKSDYTETGIAISGSLIVQVFGSR